MSEASISESERTLAATLIALALAIGLLFPALSAALYPYFLIALFFMVVFSLCIQEQRTTTVIATPDRFTGLAILWQMAGIPLVMTVVAVLAGASPLLLTIVVAVTTAGSVFASPTLASVLGLNRQIATRVMVISTCIMPFSLLFFGEITGVLPLDLSFRSYGIHILVFIIVPIAISELFWSVRPKLPSEGPSLSLKAIYWGATISLMVFCCALMTKIHMVWETHAAELVNYAILAITLAVAMYTLTVAVFFSFGPVKAITAGMLTANRNVALSFALLSSVFPPQIMTFVAVAQFPIFLTPFIARVVVALRARKARAAA